MAISISDSMQLNLAATYNELVRMINQRITAMAHYSGVGPSPLPEVAVNDQCRAANISDMQHAIEDLASHCVLASDLTGKSSFQTGDKQLFYDAIYGAGRSGFWRRATDPLSIQGWDNNSYDSPGYSYGNFSVGDIIGPWIYYDLQTAISAVKTFWLASTTPVSPASYARDARNYSNSTNWDSQSTETQSYVQAVYVANGGTYVLPLDLSLAPSGNISLINLLSGSKSIALVALGAKPSGFGNYTYDYVDLSGQSIPELSTRLFSAGSTSGTSLTFASPLTPKSFSVVNAANQSNKVRGQVITTMFYVTHAFS